jgi:hypothetical protein
MIAELHFYTVAINIASAIADATGALSLEHASRLVLAGYVERVCGAPHHGRVAGLLSESGRGADYAEDAHRQWWHRQSALLQVEGSPIPQVIGLMRHMGEVLSRRA